MKKILFFAEDPGAANYISALYTFLKDDFLIYFFATNTAYDFLIQQGFKVKRYEKDKIRNLDIDFFLFGTTSEKENKWEEIFKFLKTKDVITIGAIDAIISSDLRFSNKKLLPDYIVVPDIEILEEYKPKLLQCKFILSGHLQWIEIINKREKLHSRRSQFQSKFFSDLEKKSKKIFFISEPPPPLENNYFPENFLGYGDTNERTNICFQEIKKALDKLNVNYHLIFKLHPKDNFNNYKSFKNMVYEFVTDTRDNLARMMASDLVIGMTSNLLFQSFLLGIPTISVSLSSREKKLIPYIFRDKLNSASNRKELEMQIENNLEKYKFNNVNIELDVYKSKIKNLLMSL